MASRAPARASLPRAGAPYPLAIVGRLFRLRPGRAYSTEMDWPAILPLSDGSDAGASVSRGLGCVQRPHNLCARSNSSRTPFRRYLAGKDPFAVFPSRERRGNIALLVEAVRSRRPEIS